MDPTPTLPTEAEIFERAREIAEVEAQYYRGPSPILGWYDWGANSREDFWSSAALEFGVPRGHPLRSLPEVYGGDGETPEPRAPLSSREIESRDEARSRIAAIVEDTAVRPQPRP